MDNEHERPSSEGRESSPGPEQRVRLPGYEEPPRGRGPAYDWQGHDRQGYDRQGYDYGPPRGYGGYPPYPREGGLRSTRRASTWTAAALIAGVAVTTGYLARSIPVNGAGTSSNNTSGGTAKPAAKPSPASPGTVRPSTPAVQPPVVTSGGSGAAAGGGGGGGDN